VKNAAPAPGDGRVTATWRIIITWTLITLVGFNLRSVILAVPPVLPLIKRDLALSYTETGLLTALPVLVLAVGAWPSGFIIERIGGRLCVTIGLALLSTGALLRSFWSSSLMLFLFTVLLSFGITLAQTSIPVLAYRWFPARIGLVAALFSDGLIIGEAVGAGLTIPIMAQFLGEDAWAATLVLWGIPVIALFLLWSWLAPPAPAQAPASPTHAEVTTKTLSLQNPARPAQHARVNSLHLGIMLGAGSLIYFGMNGWIATYNQAIHYAYLTPLTLAILNTAQLPSSLGVTIFAQSLAGRRSPFIVAGAISGAAIIGWVFTPAMLEPFWAVLLGASSALVFTLGIALPPLMASPERVARLTGVTISLNYCVAFAGPLLGGELWDLFHLPFLAFLPVAIASPLLITLGALLPPRTAFGLLSRPKDTSERDPALPIMPSL
jgi:CP family cyanate transporter-like MFS transporter